MDKEQLIDRVIDQCLEEDEKAYERARAEFKERIASLDETPGVSRIRELETIWSELNKKRKTTASDAILALLKNIDEAELIEAKKASTEKEG